MLLILFGGVVGIAYLGYRIHLNIKRKRTVEELSSGRHFECLDYSLIPSLIIGVSVIMPLGFFIYSLITKNENLAAFMLAFTFMFIAEFLNTRSALKFYYDNNCCIVDDKILQYKSIKAIVKQMGNPMGRHLIATYNGDRLALFRAPIRIILEKTKLKVLGTKN